MSDSGFDVARGFPQGTKPKGLSESWPDSHPVLIASSAKEHFQIAQRYFSLRIEELRGTIISEEDRFKQLVGS